MEPQNLLIIMSDQHSRNVLGCYGHPLVRTPNLDRLAARGTRFASCWTPSPVCIPARAAFATGKYIHQIGFWDNADPYDGSIPSWHHRLRDAGHTVVSIGKLHFRSDDDDCGFSELIIPMQVIEGKGDLLGLIRDDLPVRGAAYKMAQMAGPGESPYTHYDREIAARAEKWLSTRRQGTRTSRGYCSCHLCPHTTRSPRRSSIFTGTSTIRRFRCRAFMSGRSALLIRSFRTTREPSTSMTSSASRRMCAGRWRAISACAVSWTNRPAGFSMRCRHPVSRRTRVLSTSVITATPSAREACGASPRSMKRLAACR